MKSLYELVGDHKALNELILQMTDPETGDVRDLTSEDSKTFLQWFDEDKAAMNGKMENCCRLIKNENANSEELAAQAAIYKAEADRLSRTAKQHENTAKRVKSLMQDALYALGDRKWKSPDGMFTVYLSKTAASAKPIDGIFDIDKIPVEYQSRELCGSAIKAAVKNGELLTKEGVLNAGKLFFEDGTELPGVSYLAGETCVVR
jgi:hypothetical protein